MGKETEKWKDVVGYEGLYKVSDHGNIFSVWKNANKIPRISTNKYLVVDLFKNNISKTCTVHRLVAIAFIANPENKVAVNHINFNRLDNRVENLEWNKTKENINHSSARINLTRYKKSVRKLTKSGEFIRDYSSISEASISEGCCISAISNVITGRSKSSGGFKWEMS